MLSARTETRRKDSSVTGTNTRNKCWRKTKETKDRKRFSFLSVSGVGIVLFACLFFIQSENSLDFAEKLVPVTVCPETLSAASHLCKPLYQLPAWHF